MDSLRTLLARVKALFSRQRLEQDMEDELRFHLEMEVSEMEQRGMTPADARRKARLRFGGVESVKESYRDRRSLGILENLARDARWSLRALSRTPAVTAVAVASLALGIGANTAVFSVVDAALLRLLPVKEPARLVFFGTGSERGVHAHEVPSTELFSYQRYLDLREATGEVFDGLAALTSFDWTSYVRDAEAAPGSLEPAKVRLVSGEYFWVLGVRAARGRLITPADNAEPGISPVAVISHGWWQRRFGMAEDILGRKILVNGQPFTIVGVTSEEFQGESVGRQPDFWAPLAMSGAVTRDSLMMNLRQFSFLLLMGRLREGIAFGQAEAAANAAFQRIVAAEAGAELTESRKRALGQLRITLTSGERGLSDFRTRYRRALVLLLAVVGLVLLIACANIANLLLARAAARSREMGLRLALGAGRGRLVVQLLTESAVLALAGATAGLVMARWGIRLLLAMASNGPSPVPLEARLDWRVLGFTLMVTGVTALLFGLAPALRASQVDTAASLHGSVRGMGASRMLWNKTLVVAQVSLCLVLLVGAGLFLRSLERLRAIDPGFRIPGMTIAEIDPRGGGFTQKEQEVLYRRLLARVSALPGVEKASMSSLPLLGASRRFQGVEVEGYEFQEGESNTVSLLYVTPGYFETVGIELIRGRAFTDTDQRETRRVVMVNETFARRFFTGREFLGRQVTVDGGDGGYELKAEVVGVVRDAACYSLRDSVPEMMFVPAHQVREDLQSIELRTAPGTAVAEAALRRALTEVAPELPVRRVTTLSGQVDAVLCQERLLAKLTSLFGALALLLAVVGIYGVMSYGVTRRTNEIGVRMALGAHRSRILWEVLRGSLGLVLLGSGIGLAGALACGQLIAGLLYETPAADAMALAGAVVVLGMVALAAGLLPALRASRVDPMAALRHE